MTKDEIGRASPNAPTLWAMYENDLNAMSDEDVEQECANSRNQLEEAESWLDAVAAWDAAGRPRKASQSGGRMTNDEILAALRARSTPDA